MRPGTSLDDALQDLSEDLQQRLVVLDEALRVVAYSIHESEQDRARLSHLLAHSDTWPAPPAGRNEPTVRTAADGTRWQMVPLRDERHLVGHLLHVQAKGAPPPDRAVLREGAARLGVLLALRSRDAERASARADELLTTLLSPAVADTERSAAATALVDEGLVGPAEQYCVTVVAPPPELRDDGWLARRAVETTLDFVVRTTTATVVGGVVGDLGVLVFPRPVVQDRLDRVLQAPGLAEVRAGIGGLTDGLVTAATSYEQAEIAWRAACLDPGTHPRVSTWEGFGVDKLLLRLPLEDLTRADLPAPVTRLLASDHHDVDVPTLLTYLDCGGDGRATATALRIHRSTLYYRLARIRTTTAVDLADGAVRRDLHTGLRVARLAGLLSD
ncbi:PucR family transcriptional regulator [Janibacter corallicola]|uniref:PucR family transcriptional regulator n=1 Tax=Janibacter corallicola TaxID=415212 RepID=UPI00082BEB90|nr:helix-turn-helix domain-containing protein [Janibacter corallicola]